MSLSQELRRMGFCAGTLFAECKERDISSPSSCSSSDDVMASESGVDRRPFARFRLSKVDGSWLSCPCGPVGVTTADMIAAQQVSL
jgi:hypothetical protein